MPKNPAKPTNPTTKKTASARVLIDMPGVGVTDNPGKHNRIDLTEPGEKPAST